VLRRAAVAAAGLAVMAGVGFAGGGGSASAVSPVLHIGNGAQWTLEANNGDGCEIETFAGNGTFVSDNFNDAGKWHGGASTIKLKWSAGELTGYIFKGTFTTTPVKEYKGSITGPNPPPTGQLVQGVVSSWDGSRC
jgi:hypothetical protein